MATHYLSIFIANLIREKTAKNKLKIAQTMQPATRQTTALRAN